MELHKGMASGVLVSIMSMAQVAAAQERNEPPILDDTASFHVAPGFTNISREAKCALETVQTLNIPGASLSAHTREDDGTIVVDKTRSAYIPNKNGTVTLADGTILEKRGPHYIGAGIEIQKDGSVSFSANHSGSYNDVIDASRAMITLTFNDEGKLTGRDGNAISEDFDVPPTQTEHGRWVIGASRVLEGRFAQCVNLSPADLEAVGRHPRADDEALAAPPYTPGVPAQKLEEPLF